MDRLSLLGHPAYYNTQIIGRVTSDITFGQNKLPEQTIARQYACATAGPMV